MALNFCIMKKIYKNYFLHILTPLLQTRKNIVFDEVVALFFPFYQTMKNGAITVNGVFKAFLIRVRRPKFDTSTHHFFHVWLTCRKMSGF